MIVNSFKMCVTPGRVINNQNQNIQMISYYNLKSLSKDTISFSGAARLEGEYMDFAPPLQKCRIVRKNAEPAKILLENTLNEFVTTINKDLSPQNKLIDVNVRLKSAESIREKVVSKFTKIDKGEKSEFCKNAVAQILQYYTPAEGENKTSVNLKAKLFLDSMRNYRGIPPYQNEESYLTDIIRVLETCNVIVYKGDDAEKSIETMVKTLKNQTKSEHCIKEKGAYIDPQSLEGIKHYAKDIVGARIILNNPDIDTAQKVFNGLKQASNRDRFRVLSVENYTPEYTRLPEGDKLNKYEYLPACRLESFAKSTYAEYDPKSSKSGYLAIHINVDLSNDELTEGLSKKDRNKYNGYCGEIQIMDACIEDLKDVEDLCYKLKDNKNAFNKKYDSFKTHFKKYYTPEIKETFNNYTYDLYLEQRRKSLKEGKNLDDSPFPTLEDMGYDGLIPEELDYNALLAKKVVCELKSNDKFVFLHKFNLKEIFEKLKAFISPKDREYFIDMSA